MSLRQGGLRVSAVLELSSCIIFNPYKMLIIVRSTHAYVLRMIYLQGYAYATAAGNWKRGRGGLYVVVLGGDICSRVFVPRPAAEVCFF